MPSVERVGVRQEACAGFALGMLHWLTSVSLCSYLLPLCLSHQLGVSVINY